MTALERDTVAWTLGVESSSGFSAEHMGCSWCDVQPRSPDRFGERLLIDDLDEESGRFELRHPAIMPMRAGDSV